MKKINILQLLTAILLAFMVLVIIIGLYLISLSNFTVKYDDNTSTFKDGYQLLKHFGLSYILSHSAKCFISLKHYNYSDNYYPWIQLQSGVIFCLIISPILLYTTIIFIIMIFIFKIKRKNNNFWDAIQNCEIINNYYVH